MFLAASWLTGFGAGVGAFGHSRAGWNGACKHAPYRSFFGFGFGFSHRSRRFRPRAKGLIARRFLHRLLTEEFFEIERFFRGEVAHGIAFSLGMMEADAPRAAKSRAA